MVRDQYVGVWPVMLTPFNGHGQIDWQSLARLIDWYLAAGVHGLFAVCQSSEMFFLSDQEATALARFTVDYVDGRVPVVASGHTGNALDREIDQLNTMAATGVVGIILISNRLVLPDESDAVALVRLQQLTAQLPTQVDLGIYECPHPYKRLLSDDMIRWCAESNRYAFIKDTCCHLPTLKRRVALIQGSRLNLANANSQTLLASFQVGCKAFSGIMANFHPDLYVWLYENWQTQPEKAQLVADYLSTAALIEQLDYPVCAKSYQQQLGNFATITTRVRQSNIYPNTFYPEAVSSMMRLGEFLQKTVLRG